MAVGDTFDVDENGQPLAQPLMQTQKQTWPGRQATPPAPTTRKPTPPGAATKPRKPAKPKSSPFVMPQVEMGDNRQLGQFSTGNSEYDKYIAEASQTYDLDPALLISQMKQESNFKKGAVSSAGASGLMQLMPGTAKELGVKDIFDVRQNIMAGAKYLRQQLNTFKSLPLALAAYNAGPGNVRKYKNTVPPFKETRNYVTKITNAYQQRLAQLPNALVDQAVKTSPAAPMVNNLFNQYIKK